MAVTGLSQSAEQFYCRQRQCQPSTRSQYGRATENITKHSPVSHDEHCVLHAQGAVKLPCMTSLLCDWPPVCLARVMELAEFCQTALHVILAACIPRSLMKSRQGRPAIVPLSATHHVFMKVNMTFSHGRLQAALESLFCTYDVYGQTCYSMLAIHLMILR